MEVFIAQSCPTLCDRMDYYFCPWSSPGQNTGEGKPFTFPGYLLDPEIELGSS